MKALLVEPISENIISRFKLVALRNNWELIVLSSKPELLGCDDLIWEYKLDSQLMKEIKSKKFDAIIPGGEFSIYHSDVIAQKLNLFHNSNISVNAYRDKYEMRRRFAQHNISQPNIYGIFNIGDLIPELKFPVVFKPVNMASSLCIKLCYTYESLVTAIEFFKQQFSLFDENLAFNKSFLIEEYIPGNEFSAECIINSQGLQYYQITKKFVSQPPYFDELGHVTNISFNEEKTNKLEKIISNIIKAWQLQKTVVHIEFKVLNNELYLIEVGNRIPGDRISDLIYLSSGVSLEESLWLLRSHQDFKFNLKKNHGSFGIQFLFDNTDIERVKFFHKEIIKHKKIRDNINKNLHKTHIKNRQAYVIYKSFQSEGEAL